MTALIMVGIGLALPLLTVLLLAGSAAARAGHQGPEVVLFTRSWRKPLALSVVFLLLLGASPFVGVDSNNAAFVWLLLLAFFALLFWLQFTIQALVFWVADLSGLSRQVLAFKTTLPWHEIDWVYPQRKRTNYQALGVVKVAQTTEDAIIVEAGPRRRITLALKAWLMGGDAQPLVHAIEERATNAQFGFDKQPLVLARRQGMVGVPRR